MDHFPYLALSKVSAGPPESSTAGSGEGAGDGGRQKDLEELGPRKVSKTMSIGLRPDERLNVCSELS
jgi:hypothetical protein